MATVVPAKFLSVDETSVVLACNVGTLQQPHIQPRRFDIAPFAEMVKGFPKHPKEKYLTITITGRNGSYSFAYDLVEGTPEFQKEF